MVDWQCGGPLWNPTNNLCELGIVMTQFLISA